MPALPSAPAPARLRPAAPAARHRRNADNRLAPLVAARDKDGYEKGVLTAKNIRAIQLLLGHTKLESTVPYLGIEVDDALEISEQTEI